MRFDALRNAWKGERSIRAGMLSAAVSILLVCSHAQWIVNDLHGIYVPNQSGSANYAWRISEATPDNNYRPYIVGQAGQGIFGFPVAYRYQLGVDPVGSPGRVISGAVAYGVNNKGWFVGRLTTGQQAMVWHPSYGAQPINPPQGVNTVLNTAFDINDNGVIVGYAVGGFFGTHGGFVSYFNPSDGSTTTYVLDGTLGNPSAGTSINNAGTAGGGTGIFSGWVAEPYIEPGYAEGAAGWINLTGSPGNFVGSPIVPRDYNNVPALIWDISDGAIPQYAAAWAGQNPNPTPLVYVWAGAGYNVIALPLPAGASGGRAYGVNNRGHVVGYYLDSIGRRFAALWWFNGSSWQIVDLTQLAQSAGYMGWTLNAALDINNDMCIVGYGVDPQNRLTSYVMCVVPEPASMLALGAGLAGLIGLRRRKR